MNFAAVASSARAARLALACLFVGGLLPGLGCSKAPPPPPEPVEEVVVEKKPEAPSVVLSAEPADGDELLQRVGDYYRQHDDLAVTWERVLTKPATLYPQPERQRYQVQFQRPNLISLVRETGGEAALQFYCDGERQWLVFPGLERYVESPAASDLAAMLSGEQFRLTTGPIKGLLLKLFAEDPAAALAEWAKQTRYDGRFKDGDIYYMQLQVRTEEGNFTLWIDAGPEPKLLRLKGEQRGVATNLADIGRLSGEALAEASARHWEDTFSDWTFNPRPGSDFTLLPTHPLQAMPSFAYLPNNWSNHPLIGKTLPLAQVRNPRGPANPPSQPSGPQMILLTSPKLPEAAADLAALRQVYLDYSLQDVKFFATLVRTKPDEAERWLRLKDLTVDLVPENPALMSGLDVQALPVAVIVDQQQVIQSIRVGRPDDLPGQVRGDLQAMLDRQSHLKQLREQVAGETNRTRLVELLGHWDDTVFRQAGTRLLVLGTPALDDLQQGLRSDSPIIRERSADVLAAFGERALPAAGALIARFQDPVFTVRLAARNALVRMGPSIIKPLEEVLDLPDAGSRSLAAQALGSFGPRAQTSVAALVARLGDEDDEVRQQVRLALRKIGSASLDPLAAAFIDENEQVHTASREALVSFGRAGVEPLIGGLEYDRPHIRPELQVAMDALAKQDPQAAEEIREALRVQTTIENLTALSIPELVGRFNAEKEPVRLAAAEELGTRGSAAVAPLLSVLKTGETPQQILAVYTLGLIGPEAAAEALPALIETLSSRSSALRNTAAAVVAKYGPAAVDPLKQTLQTTSLDRTRRGVYETLANLGPAAAPLTDTLVAGLGDPDRYVRQDAAAALVALGEAGHQRLLAALDDDRTLVYQTAGQALHLAGESVVAPLTERLGHEQRQVRAWSAVALGNLGAKAEPALPKLETLARRDPDENVRFYARQAIEKITSAPGR